MDPKTHGKNEGVYMGEITLKNEGYGFPWLTVNFGELGWGDDDWTVKMTSRGEARIIWAFASWEGGHNPTDHSYNVGPRGL